jgi:hypothetical protein
MSIKLMCAAFDAEVPSTQKLVLLALCDNANDEGHCFPSISTLERKCSLSDRAVQLAVGWLEANGFLTRQFRTGRATLYVMTPERGSPPNDVHPRTIFTPPPNDVHPTPERGSPLTIREPSENRQKNRGTRFDLTSLPDDWQEFCRSKRPDLKPLDVFDAFRDYWIAQPGSKGLKADWTATWRNWIRNTRVSPNSQPAKQDRKMDLLMGRRQPDVVTVIDADYQERLNALSRPSF